MLTIIIPHLIRKESFEEVKKKLEIFKTNDLELVIATYENSNIANEILEAKESSKGVKTILKLFRKNATEEGMIDACLRHTVAHEVVVIRQKSNIDVALIQRLLAEIRKGADVVMPRKAKKKNIFSKLGEKFVKTFMGIYFYEGDVSLEAFSSRALSILKLGNSTLMTKTDKLVGMSIVYVDADIEEKVYESKKSLAPMIVCYSLSVLMLAGCITLGVLKLLPWIAFMGFLFAIIVFMTFGIYYSMKFSVTRKLGEISADKVGTIDSVEKQI